MLKKLSILFLVLFSLNSLVGCSDDEEKENVDENTPEEEVNENLNNDALNAFNDVINAVENEGESFEYSSVNNESSNAQTITRDSKGNIMGSAFDEGYQMIVVFYDIEGEKGVYLEGTPMGDQNDVNKYNEIANNFKDLKISGIIPEEFFNEEIFDKNNVTDDGEYYIVYNSDQTKVLQIAKDASAIFYEDTVSSIDLSVGIEVELNVPSFE